MSLEETKATQAPEGSETATAPVKDAQETGTEQAPREDGKQPEAPKKSNHDFALARLARQKNEAREEAAQAKRQLADALSALAAARGGEKSKLDDPAIQAEIDRKATEKAARISGQRSFDEACNQTYEAGIKEFDDFQKSVDTLRNMELMQPTFLNVVNEQDEPHKILHHLGQNPSEAERISSLSPTKQSKELAKLALTMNAKPVDKDVSKAPDPIKPLVKTKSDSTPMNDPNASASDFAKFYKQQRMSASRK